MMECAATHCHRFDDTQKNLNKLSVVLPPDLSTLLKEIIYLLEFDQKLMMKVKPKYFIKCLIMELGFY